MSTAKTTTTTTALRPGTRLGCGHVVPVLPAGSIGTGYGRDADTGETFCYPCANEREAKLFAESSDFVAYVSSDGLSLTTWPGGVLARYVPGSGGVSRSGWHGSEVHSYRFRAEDGSEWYGRNGGPGMVIRVRRAKTPPALPTVSGTIVSVDRVGTSRNGNPTWDIRMSDGETYRTETDGSVGYSVSNFAPSSRRPARPVVLTLTRSGRRVQGLQYADGSSEYIR